LVSLEEGWQEVNHPLLGELVNGQQLLQSGRTRLNQELQAPEVALELGLGLEDFDMALLGVDTTEQRKRAYNPIEVPMEKRDLGGVFITPLDRSSVTCVEYRAIFAETWIHPYLETRGSLA